MMISSVEIHCFSSSYHVSTPLRKTQTQQIRYLPKKIRTEVTGYGFSGSTLNGQGIKGFYGCMFDGPLKNG